jgi:hypothetical protein
MPVSSAKITRLHAIAQVELHQEALHLVRWSIPRR